MIAAFAVKGPVPPFHTWMPTVLMEGPIGMAIVLVGLKLGVYGMLRFVIPIMPEASYEWYGLMTWLGAASVLYGGAIALVQSNLRRLLAFASVSHVGLIVLGLFSLNMQSMQGSLILMLHVGLTATTMMFLVGTLMWRTGSSELSAFGGIARQAPRLAVAFFVLGIASIGMPGTSGFLGEFMVLLGSSLRDWRLAAVAVLGVILSAGYFLWYYERAFFGPPGRNVATISDLMPREFAVAGVMIALVFWAGVYPAPFLNITGGSVNALVEHVERRTGGTQ
jgi:NADH-quinone oxidoreductase subunit M